MAEKLRIEFEGDMKELRSELRKMLDDVEGTGAKGGKKFGSGFSQGFKDAFAGFTAANLATRGIDAAFASINKGIENMIAKESALADFSAITGVAGYELQMFGAAAEELSNKFGTTTVENIEAFKGVLSRLGPDFASSADAVKLMGDNINTLALAAGLSAPESMDALTTAMLQFGVDLSDPMKAAEEATRMMNEMAAGAKEGAAEVPQIAAAMKQVGSTAASLKVSSLEVNAFLQTLAMGGKAGSEAGVALRNVLTSLIRETGPSTEALSEMGLTAQELGTILTSGPGGANNALKSLKEGLERMSGPAERNAALVKIFGVENLAAAQTMISLTNETDKLSEKLRDTNTATEQAGIIMNTTEQRWARFSAFIDNTLVGSLEGMKSRIADISGGLADLFSGGNFVDAMQDILDPSAAQGKRWARQKKQAEIEKKEREKQEAEKRKAAEKAKKEQDRLFGEEQGNAKKTVVTLDDLMRKREELEKSRGKIAEGDVQSARALDREISAVQRKIDALSTPKKTGSKPKKESPLAGTIGALEQEISELEKTLKNKLRPGSEAFEDMKGKVALLKAELRDLNGELKDTIKIIALGEKDMRPLGTPEAPIVDVPGMRTQVDATLSTMDILQAGVSATTLSIASIGQTIGNAFASGGDGLKELLKMVGGQIITFVEGSIAAAEGFSLVEALFTAGASLIKDAPLLALAFAALETGRAVMNSLDVGGFLRTDQTIKAHADESVIPLRKVPAIWAETIDRTGTGPRSNTRAPYVFPRPSEMQGSMRVSYDNLSRGTRNASIKQSRRVG